MIEEFKDACQDLTTMSEEIAADLRDLPTDYKLAERCLEIDQEVYDMLEWYEQIKRERRMMDARAKKVEAKLKKLNNDVQSLKLREFSHAQHGGSYSQLPQFLRQ